jgi:hypothetical protein
MYKMTIGGAFTATMDFIRQSWHVLLGSLVVALVVTGVLGALLVGNSFDPMAMADPARVMGVIGGLFLLIILFIVFYYAACFLSWRHGLTGGAEPVLSNIGWAMGAGALFALAMLVVTFVAYIILYIVIIILALLFAAVFGLSGLSFESLAAGDAAAMGGGVIAAVAIFYVLMIVASLWFTARLSVAGPVMADLRTVNPITGLGRSWQMTGPSQWTIVGFFLLLAVISFALFFVVGLVFGGMMAGFAAGADPAAAAGFGIGTVVLMMLLYVPFLLVAVAVPAGIYRALAPVGSGDVFA